MRILILFFLSLSLLACNKPDPNPELKDEIYADLNSQLAETGHALEAEEKQLEEYKKALEDVKPQTGQIKYAQKRVFDSQEKINKLEQKKKWLTLRVADRLKTARISYLKAFSKGKPWPDPSEFERYKEEARMQNIKREWDVKARLREAGIAVTSKKSRASAEKSEKKEEVPKE